MDNKINDMNTHEYKCGKDGSGKDDRVDNKPRWELLPLDAVEEIVKVYTMGAKKYADNAWKTIPDAHRRYLAALFRHIAAYERGERKDSESGLSHLAHAAWNAIAILWLDLHKIEEKNNEGENDIGITSEFKLCDHREFEEQSEIEQCLSPSYLGLKHPSEWTRSDYEKFYHYSRSFHAHDIISDPDSMGLSERRMKDEEESDYWIKK